MAWAKPLYSKERIKKAGITLVKGYVDDVAFEDIEDAFQVLNNWRSSHSYPVNTFQASLRAKLVKLGIKATVAQRLKRIPSILNKLQLNPKMSLSRMQDIGGLRAVVPTITDVNKLRHSYITSRFDHILVSEKDYIADPKPSGYRGVHLVYKYYNRKGSGPDYEALQVEIQIRNKMQHAWATAVETAGLFLGQALKSSIGNERWLEFFTYASSAFAILEKAPIYEGHRNLEHGEIFSRVIELERELEIIGSLEMYKAAIDYHNTGDKDSHYFLMRLDPSSKKGSVSGFARNELLLATEQYLQEERAVEGSGVQVVLVAAQSIDALKKAYPNYFMDTGLFVARLRRIQLSVAEQEAKERMQQA